MGKFRIVIEGVGGHGCARELGKGDKITAHDRCGRPGCPDCAALSAVQRLQDGGNSLETAELTHWPGQKEQVVDNLLTGERDADFPERARALKEKSGG